MGHLKITHIHDNIYFHSSFRNLIEEYDILWKKMYIKDEIWNNL